LTTFYINMEQLTSGCMLLPFTAVSGFTYCFEMSILGHTFGGGNSSVVVDSLESVFQLFLSQGHIG
jgi:hypothetical protein